MDGSNRDSRGQGAGAVIPASLDSPLPAGVFDTESIGGRAPTRLPFPL